jgi:hypothetical protein
MPSSFRKRFMNRSGLACLALALFAAPLPSASAADVAPSDVSPKETPQVAAPKVTAPKVTAPPDSIFEKIRDRDRDVARAFYKKYVDIGGGLCCMASSEVSDEALLRTRYIVTHMLANRPDIIEAMAKAGTRLIIIGKDQVYTDMPEYRSDPDPAFKNERVRGTGGLGITSFGEENLLNLPIDRYDDESIGVHEFCHTIDSALRTIDPTWGGRGSGRLAKTYQNAVEKGLYKYAYTGSNQAEYWAEICQSYFDCNRTNNWNHGPVGTREQLKEYDPEGYELVRTTFKLSPENDWRYTPVRTQPSVIAPPERFKIDPHYTKFTWAREFPIVGTPKVSDEALLKANDTVRKTFAYRHDLLKALINDGGKLVVLGKGERLADLPELKDDKSIAEGGPDRSLDYSIETKTLVVPEENILGGPCDPMAGESLVIGEMAKAVYLLTASREADPKFERVRGNSQQYEQRLVWNKPSEPIKRLDVEFDLRVRKLFDDATAKGLWRGTPAGRDKAEYFATGVQAYFDASGRGYPPVGNPRPITTREELRAYDPELFTLVDETMLYDGRQDWRYQR